MADMPVYDEPSDATAEQNAEQNVVHVQGPAAIEVSMTPKVALETARRIEEAAVDAMMESVRGSADGRPTLN